jgi:hypothetical protein
VGLKPRKSSPGTWSKKVFAGGSRRSPYATPTVLASVETQLLVLLSCEWAIGRLYGFSNLSSALAVDDLAFSLDRYLRRVVARWYNAELIQLELQTNKVHEFVRHTCLELEGYRLVQDATEARLRRRIAQLEATMLCMFSQTALQAGVEEARMIEPELESSFSTQPNSLSSSAPSGSPSPPPRAGGSRQGTSSPMTSTHLSLDQSPIRGSSAPPRSSQAVSLLNEGTLTSPSEAGSATSKELGSTSQGMGSPTSGIGLLLSRAPEQETGGPVVSAVRSGAKVGHHVKIGDVLEYVNDVDVGTLALADIHNLIAEHKKAGRTIQLKLARREAEPGGVCVRFVATAQ